MKEKNYVSDVMPYSGALVTLPKTAAAPSHPSAGSTAPLHSTAGPAAPPHPRDTHSHPHTMKYHPAHTEYSDQCCGSNTIISSDNCLPRKPNQMEEMYIINSEMETNQTENQQNIIGSSSGTWSIYIYACD